MNRPTRLTLTLSLVFASLAGPCAFAAPAGDGHRQADVARRGADVMPFSLDATLHVFTRQRNGGVQRVLARDRGDAHQVALVRQHLREIRAQFLRGDFSGPSHIHGADMPGLAELQAAAPGQLAIRYREVPGGAELVFRSRSRKLVAALHQWFDAQVSDHGKDAMAGHEHHHHPGHGEPEKPTPPPAQ
jgi:hypothetical protein